MNTVEEGNSFQETKEKIFQAVLQDELKETILTKNPLKTAIEKNKIFAAKYYIETTQNIFFDLEYPLKWAIENDHLDIAKTLIQKGASKVLGLLHCIYSGNCEVLKYLIENKADIHQFNSLLTAVEEDKEHIVKILLENGADVHLKNDKPLIQAVSKGLIGITKLLLQYGANVHVDNDYCLRKAVFNRDTILTKVLLENGANVHTENHTCLIYCTQVPHENILKVLAEHGANIAENNSILIEHILKHLLRCRCFDSVDRSDVEKEMKDIEPVLNIIVEECKKVNKIPSIIVDLNTYTRTHVRILRSKGVNVTTIGPNCIIL